MASTVKAPIRQMVIYRTDGSVDMIDVDAGVNLQGLVFDETMAKKCPAPHEKWPPPGVHGHGTAAGLPTTDPPLATTSTMTATAMDAPPPPDPPPGCYLVDGVLYCP